MGKMTKYSDLKPFDVFNWGSSVYIWLGDQFDSIMVIAHRYTEQKGKFEKFTGGLIKYDEDDNEVEYEVIGRMGFIGVETDAYYFDEPELGYVSERLSQT